MYRKMAVVVVVCVLGSSGCVDDGPSASSDLWCDGLCAAQQRCGDTRDADTCRGMCVRDRPGLANISTGGAAALRPCLSGLSCGALSDPGTWETELDACWEEAKLGLDPTPKVRDFCEVLAETDFECGYWSPTRRCEENFGMWADAVLDSVSVCEARITCDDRDACITEVFENL
jgi:hypothetical protein